LKTESTTPFVSKENSNLEVFTYYINSAGSGETNFRRAFSHGWIDTRLAYNGVSGAELLAVMADRHLWRTSFAFTFTTASKHPGE